jgi:transposase
MANLSIKIIMIKEIIRLKENGISHKQIREILNLSRTTVIKYVKRIEASGFSYAELQAMEDNCLHDLFHSEECQDKTQRYAITEGLFAGYEKELTQTGVTKWLLWAEYKNKHPDGYSYSQFCYHYQTWCDYKNTYMHIEHKSGDKMFVDYAGKKLHTIDKETGEVNEVEVFVGILGASQRTYVEASIDQTIDSFITSVENAFWYFKGVPRAVVPDNLKSAVTKSSKYEPTLNERFSHFSGHYNTCILPARSYKPKDKALVEGAVRIVYHRIYAALRHRMFFSIKELNEAIWELLENYNNIPFQGRDESRMDLFNEIERSVLGPLPAQKYEIKKYKLVMAQKNCHVYFLEDKHYYSIPYRYIGKRVKVVYTGSLIEVYYNYTRIACHIRDYKKYGYTTIKEHLPEHHRYILGWNPDMFINQAAKIGSSAEELIRQVLKSKPHPEQGYKSCQGILSFAGKVGPERLNNACKRAIDFQTYNYMVVKNILEKGLDRITEDDESLIQAAIPFHENIRGSKYYN